VINIGSLEENPYSSSYREESLPQLTQTLPDFDSVKEEARQLVVQHALFSCPLSMSRTLLYERPELNA
jgi:hypothetical protein